MAQKDVAATKQAIVAELVRSYTMEVETVLNYLANSIHLDGLKAAQVRAALADDITEELTHAQQLGDRIKELFGDVPGSLGLKFEQTKMQPPTVSTDIVAIIKGVIEAEQGAIEQYQKIVDLCDGVDYVTQDLCIALMADEESHRRLFIGFLKEFEDVSAYVAKARA